MTKVFVMVLTGKIELLRLHHNEEGFLLVYSGSGKPLLIGRVKLFETNLILGNGIRDFKS